MQNRAYRVIARQVGITALVALAAWFAAGRSAAVSAFWGGTCAWVPALAYLWRARMVRDQQPRTVLRAQYAGEGMKFAVSLLMFQQVFTRLDTLVPPAFFAAFAAAQLGYFVALLRDRD